MATIGIMIRSMYRPLLLRQKESGQKITMQISRMQLYAILGVRPEIRVVMAHTILTLNIIHRMDCTIVTKMGKSRKMK